MQTIDTAFKEVVKEALREVLAEQAPQAPTAGLPEGKPTLTVREAAAIVGVSEPTMYDITHRADFPACITVGRKRVILRHKLYEWMEQQAGQKEGTA